MVIAVPVVSRRISSASSGCAIMIKSLPEYVITKPGMSHSLSRKRVKPLRTYGRRSASAPEPRGESASKRVRLDADRPVSTDADSSQATYESTPKDKAAGNTRGGHRTSAPGPEENLKCSSIRNYFKPVAPDGDDAPPDKTKKHASGDPAPPSPGVTPIRQKPRLLRLQAASPPLSDASKDSVREWPEDPDETEGDRADPGYGRGGSEERDSALRDGGGNLVNKAWGETRAEARLGGTAKNKKTPTQMTLNLSAQAAFAECKVCDMVWNPLYPDDVKCHAKRHATVAGARRKRQDEL